ncbi:MAG: DUF1887 family protein [Clostridia bacterium]|nr:DUF1887 family protein [Clostridia bacterium]
MLEIKTLIELFDSCQIENVIAGLRFKPEKIIFVGFKEVMTRKRTEDLKRFFELRGVNIATEYEVVGRYDFDFIVNKLNEILDNNEDCCFDLTGGKELVLAAMGMVSALRDIPMLQFNVRSGNLIRVKNCDDIEDTQKSSMLISESVVLNGGVIVYNDNEDFKWELTADFKRDIDTIWRMCKRNCGLWNRQSNVFESFERFGRIDDTLTVSVSLKHMRDGKHDTMLNSRIINELIKNELIMDFVCEEDYLTFRYKNVQVRQCLIKAGNILELYAYMTAREIAKEEPDYYDDIDIGVFVDWDGIIHDGTTQERDTRNEIDIILMRDLIPIFISCKNGEVHKEALYELSAVAERFGGEYAKKILLTTYVSQDAESRKYLLQRARDMQIDVIEGVDRMDKDEFFATLRKRAK